MTTTTNSKVWTVPVYTQAFASWLRGRLRAADRETTLQRVSESSPIGLRLDVGKTDGQGEAWVLVRGVYVEETYNGSGDYDGYVVYRGEAHRYRRGCVGTDFDIFCEMQLAEIDRRSSIPRPSTLPGWSGLSKAERAEARSLYEAALEDVDEAAVYSDWCHEHTTASV